MYYKCYIINIKREEMLIKKLCEKIGRQHYINIYIYNDNKNDFIRRETDPYKCFQQILYIFKKTISVLYKKGLCKLI